MADERMDLRDEIRFVIETSIDEAKRKKFEEMGSFYIKKVVNILYSTPTDYPTFISSDIYDEDKDTEDLYENEEDDPVVTLGSIPT